MTASMILGYMSKCAQPNEYQVVRRSFHNLSDEAKRLAIEYMLQGIAPKRAVAKAKREAKQAS